MIVVFFQTFHDTFKALMRLVELLTSYKVELLNWGLSDWSMLKNKRLLGLGGGEAIQVSNLSLFFIRFLSHKGSFTAVDLDFGDPGHLIDLIRWKRCRFMIWGTKQTHSADVVENELIQRVLYSGWRFQGRRKMLKN